MRPWFLNRLLIASALALCLSGCANLPFYWQAARGQMDLNKRRVPINEVIADPATDEALRQRLQLAADAQAFAVTELALPDNGSYRSYADLERPYVTWNVFAAPEFSTQAKTWCYPITGCVSYRGYFKEAAARKIAGRYAERGLDTYVGGVSAYSTLGRLKDPVVSSMLGRNDSQLISTIFHELAHQQLYIKGDSAFNESFATAVALEGLRRWVAARNESEQILSAWQQQAARHRDFVSLVQITRDALASIYAQDMSADAMRQAKTDALAEMQRDYAALKVSWNGFDRYDAWFESVNNAKLGSIGTYHDWVPAFRVLFSDAGGDFSTFYAETARLGALEPLEREAALTRLTERADQLL